MAYYRTPWYQYRCWSIASYRGSSPDKQGESLILQIRWSPSIICPIIPSGLYPGGLKTGELVHTSQSQDRTGEEFYDRKTTPDSSEDRTAVPTMVKMESELFVCTQQVSTLHTHTVEELQTWVTKPTNLKKAVSPSKHASMDMCKTVMPVWSSCRLTPVMDNFCISEQ